MENIYPPTHFECTEKLTDLSEHFSSYKKLYDFPSYGPGNSSAEYLDMQKKDLILRDFVELMDIGKKHATLKNIVDTCSVEALSVDGELECLEVEEIEKNSIRMWKYYGFVKDPEKLETTKVRSKHGSIAPKLKDIDNIALRPKRTNKIDLPPDTMLIFVRVYQPFSATADKIMNIRPNCKLKCSHEIVVLDCNLLSDLRDKILCGNDNLFTIDIADSKKQEGLKVKEEYPSGLIGIDDVLYIDTRNPKAIDYSEVIKVWGKNKNVADFKSAIMSAVQIKDLNFRLGYPYIYQHHGDCEHVLVFADVRLINNEDSVTYADYPYYRKINMISTERCNICHVSNANLVCCECDRLPHDRTYLCEDCFMSYNYINGERIGTFKAYPYYSKALLM